MTGSATRFMVRLLALFLALQSAPASAATLDLDFWYSSSGAPGATLELLVARFNAAQSGYRIRAQRRELEGLPDAPPAATAATAATAVAGPRPHLVQLDQVRTGMAMTHPGLLKPLWQLTASAGVFSERTRLLPAISGTYLDKAGRLLAWPLAAATPVLFFNRSLLRRAGVEDAAVPRTWYEMPKLLGALNEQGLECPYTSAWPAWVHLENLGAWHNQAFATRGNGLSGGPGGDGAKLSFNTQLMIRHTAMLASWAKGRYFVYAGPGDEAERRFARGECALLTTASASHGALQEALGAELGVAPLPYYDDFPDAPQNTLGAGSALWAVAGKSVAEYRGVAAFISFLSGAVVQAEWHQKTGFLPLSREAYEITRQSGFYRLHPGQEAAVVQLLAKAPKEYSRGIRVPHFAQVRGIIDEELEAALSLKKTPKDALDDAVERGNRLLRSPAGAGR